MQRRGGYLTRPHMYYGAAMMMAAKTSFSVLLMFQNQLRLERDFLNVCEYVHNKMDYFPASRIHIYVVGEF